MKKQIFNLAAALTALALIVTACDKNNGGNGNNNGTAFVINAANVENGNSNIATVKALMYNDIGSQVVALAEYKNGGFVLNLPANVPDEYLEPIYYDDELSGMISDKKAQIGNVYIYAYDINENQIGGFYYYPINYIENVDCETEIMYADRYFTMNGTFTDYGDTIVYNCTFKRGWNIMYCIGYDYDDYYKVLVTTQKPSGINFKWYYYGWYRECGSTSEKHKNMIFKKI